MKIHTRLSLHHRRERRERRERRDRRERREEERERERQTDRRFIVPETIKCFTPRHLSTKSIFVETKTLQDVFGITISSS